MTRPSASSAYNDEATLVLSEIDPALNNSATPATFDLRNYAPRYFLVNGKASPATAPIVSTAGAGNKVLLRYANAGLNSHSMGILGRPRRSSRRRQPPRLFAPGHERDDRGRRDGRRHRH